jgi:hypothetical protein
VQACFLFHVSELEGAVSNWVGERATTQRGWQG